MISFLQCPGFYRKPRFSAKIMEVFVSQIPAFIFFKTGICEISLKFAFFLKYSIIF